MWTTSPESVNSFGTTFILDKYEVDYIYRFKKGSEITSIEESFNHFDKLLSDMAHVKNGDRLHEIKREVFLTLIDLSKKLNQEDKTIDLLNELVQYDNKDIDLAVLRAKTFLTIENKKDDGFLALKKLHKQFPNLHKISKIYTKLLIDRDDIPEAFHAYYGHKFANFAQNGTWILAFHSGGGFNQAVNRRLAVQIKENREMGKSVV